MAYFTDPMGEEFRKALEEAMKDGAVLEDPDAEAARLADKKPSKRSTAVRKKKNARSPRIQKAPKRTPKKPLLSRKLAEELR